jgi:hypothetical protein
VRLTRLRVHDNLLFDFVGNDEPRRSHE